MWLGGAQETPSKRAPESLPTRLPIDFSVWAGLKLGVGFAIGTSLVSMSIVVVVLVLISIGIGGLHR
jgi:hypothetical protein